MQPTDRNRIVARYNQRLAQYGDDIRTLASGTEERRRLRFDVLTEIGIENGCRVLDLGCGFGDYLGYLLARGIHVNYTGYDINPELIGVATGKYPQGSFAVRDIQTAAFPQFDFIVSSGCFNLELEGEDNYAFIGDLLRVCHEHARRGVAIDFMSTHADFVQPGAFHYDPMHLFALAKGLTKRVALRHDYPLYEFCLYLYPDFAGWTPTA